MQWQPGEPQYTALMATTAGAVTILESSPGARRDAVVEQWLGQATEAGAATWRLECAQETGGVWAGLGDLVESLLPQILRDLPDLAAACGYEISLVLPRYEGQLQVTRPLTETTAPGERTRNYPADRVDRSLHGLIDLLSVWHQRSGAAPFALACDNFDRANGLVQRFFHHLVRRRGQQMGLQLLVCAGPGRGDDLAAGFPAVAVTAVTAGFRLGSELGSEQAPLLRIDPEEMAERARALEARVRPDPYRNYVDLPRLIDCWRHSSEPERALRWQVSAINILNHRGLYQVSLDYADEVEANLQRIPADDSDLYLAAVNGLYFCRVTLGHAELARQTTENALDRVVPAQLPHLYYMLAMLHARFLDDKDLAVAERYLGQALDLVATIEMADDDRQFLTVFLNNGLALVRVRQRRAADAVALCEAGLARLQANLAPDKHRLHHSVLLYNIAQVYAQVGPYDRAIEYFGQTMAMDPNYSEYYNDRGSLYFKMGQLEEAESDFKNAITLSPPYSEVWVNLGQCYRAMGRMADAVSAYSRALDLEPEVSLAVAGRADAHASLGCLDEAGDDYDTALRLDPTQALVWAGRAIVRYEQGQVVDALDDLNEAVALAPDLGELRQNRAVALQDLGFTARAAEDLQRYLALCPSADDRAEVEAQLESLLSAAAS